MHTTHCMDIGSNPAKFYPNSTITAKFIDKIRLLDFGVEVHRTKVIYTVHNTYVHNDFQKKN